MNRKTLLIIAIVAFASAAMGAALVALFLTPPQSALALSGKTVAAAGTPTVMTYQGYLTDAGGAPIDGSVNLVFTIYPTESSPTVLWTETHNGIQVTDGYFTVLLGETTPLDAEVFSGEERWLAVTVNETPMPRQRITATPYALSADRISGVEGARRHMLLAPLESGVCSCLGPLRLSGVEVASLPWSDAGGWSGNASLEKLANGTPYHEFDGSTVIYWPDNNHNGGRNSMAAMAWVKFDNAASDSEMILSKYTSSSDWMWYMNRRNSAGNGRLQFCTSTDGVTGRAVESDQTLDSDTWYFVAFRYNNNDGMFLYLGLTDGTFYTYTEGSATGTLHDSSATYALGGYNTTGQLDGQMLVPVPLLGRTDFITEEWIEDYYRRTLILVSE